LSIGEKEKKMKAWNKTLIAIIAILILEALALIKGIDGAGLASAIAVIAALGGYQVGRKLK